MFQRHILWSGPVFVLPFGTNRSGPTMERPTLFLDFDGVICDSIDECFVSSWFAFFPEQGELPDRVDLSAHRLFVGYRPFIRRGADYLLLQHCIAQGIPLRSQGDFDAREQAEGVKRMDEFHRKFYRAREYFLSTAESYWLGLNRVYPGLKEPLSYVAKDSWILTTKEADFAHRILLSQGISWDISKIICTGKDRKLDIINDIMGQDAGARGVFVDDQIDHFSGEIDPRVTCLLAEWGYVKPEWLRRGVEGVSISDFAALLRNVAQA